MSFIVVGVCYRPPEQEGEIDEVLSLDNWKKTHFSQNDQMFCDIQQEEVTSPALGRKSPMHEGEAGRLTS